jgi:hypothetical protein
MLNSIKSKVETYLICTKCYYLFIIRVPPHSLKLMDVWRDPITVKLRKANTPERNFELSYNKKAHFFRFGGVIKL